MLRIAPPALLAEELADRRAIRQKHRRQIQVERCAPRFVSHVVQRPIAPRAPGSTSHVIERVEASERPHGGSDGLRYGVGLRCVASEDERRRTQRVLSGGYRRARQAECDHPGAFPQETCGRTKADAARSTDNDDRSPIQRARNRSRTRLGQTNPQE